MLAPPGMCVFPISNDSWGSLHTVPRFHVETSEVYPGGYHGLLPALCWNKERYSPPHMPGSSHIAAIQVKYPPLILPHHPDMCFVDVIPCGVLRTQMAGSPLFTSGLCRKFCFIAGPVLYGCHHKTCSRKFAPDMPDVRTHQ